VKGLRSFWLLPILGVGLLTLTGCGTFKSLMSGSPDTVTRILADITCITVAAEVGLTVIGDPTVNGAQTASGVLAAINTIGASNLPAKLLAACKDTLALAPQDAEASAVLVTNTTGTDLPKLSPPKMAGPKPVAPKKPTPVVVPVPRK
jgi:hypothetical protein